MSFNHDEKPSERGALRRQAAAATSVPAYRANHRLALMHEDHTLSKRRKKSLQDKLDALDGNERAKLYKRARQLRKMAANSSKRKKKPNDWDEDSNSFVRMRKRSKSLEDYVTELLEFEELDGLMDVPDAESSIRGTVVNLGPGTCRAETPEGHRLDCRLGGDLAIAQKTDLAVGDEVILERAGDTHRVAAVLPRRTFLSRPDPHHGEIVERVVASNIDHVVIVVAVQAPPLRPGLIDRYLLAIRRGRASPIICVNKLDLLDDEGRAESLEMLAPYKELGVPLVPCSALRREGIKKLADLLRERTCVFVGHSGVGKSSLLNALAPELQLATGRVTRHAGKGRHTTASSTLYDLEEGFRVIDTPGIREFGISKLSPAELRWYFDEFDAHAPHCRFADCTHTHEPRCAVRQAAEAGKISDYRWRTYQRLVDELRS